jgi:hypothetical protein
VHHLMTMRVPSKGIRPDPSEVHVGPYLGEGEVR